MKIEQKYSHLNGLEWIMVHQADIWKQIQRVVAGISAEQCRTKVSKEKTKAGKLLYSPTAINACFRTELKRLGWSEVRTSYWITDDSELIRRTMTLTASEQRSQIESSGKRPIRSYNQTDFQKNRVAIEVQFGKYAFIAYDLFVKHMAFYVGDKIDVGVEILPMKSMQEKMSSGIGYYESSLYDIVRQGRGVPAVPLVLLGVVP
jgi:Restriction endonuclease BglII